MNGKRVLSLARRSSTHITKQGQHLVVCSVIRDEEAQVGLIEDSGDADQTSPAAWDYGDVLPCILTFLALPVMSIVQVRDGNS